MHVISCWSVQLFGPEQDISTTTGPFGKKLRIQGALTVIPLVSSDYLTFCVVMYLLKKYKDILSTFATNVPEDKSFPFQTQNTFSNLIGDCFHI